jgi:hypothetical protein
MAQPALTILTLLATVMRPNVTPVADGTTAICDFADTTWSSASFTTSGAMIYNTNNANSACAVLSFGGDIGLPHGLLRANKRLW